MKKKTNLSDLLSGRMNLHSTEKQDNKTQGTIELITTGNSHRQEVVSQEPEVIDTTPLEKVETFEQKEEIIYTSQYKISSIPEKPENGIHKKAKHISQAMHDFLVSNRTTNFSKNHLLRNTEYYQNQQSRFFNTEQERFLSNALFKIIQKGNVIESSEPDIDSITYALMPIYRDTSGTRDYSSDFFPVDFSIGDQEFTAEINRYTGFIKDSTITVDSLYRSLRLLQDKTFDINDLDICVNSKTRDELSKKSILLGVASLIKESNYDPQGQSICFSNLKQLLASTDQTKISHINMAKKNDKIMPYDIIDDSENPLEEKATELVLSMVSGNGTIDLAPQEEALLNFLLNPTYCSRNPSNEVRFTFNKTSYEVFPDPYTGYLNNGVLKSETLYQILKILSAQVDIDMRQLSDCVNTKRSDDFIKGRILTRVKSKIYDSYGLTEERRQQYLDNLDTLESWINVHKTAALEKAREKNKLARNLGHTADETTAQNIILAKRVFQIKNKDALALEDTTVKQICIEQVSKDQRLASSISSELTTTLDTEEETAKEKQTQEYERVVKSINDNLGSIVTGSIYNDYLNSLRNNNDDGER